jgi:Flp pilus assembly protein TadG
MKRRRRSQSGNIFVEFAIGSGILVAVFTGTFLFGYNFYRYNTLATAVADGARYASLIPYDSSTTTPSAAFLTKVQNMVVYGDPSGTNTTPVAPGLTTSNVQLAVTFSSSTPGKGIPVTMTVYLSNYTLDAVFGKTTYNQKPSVTYIYEGVYSPF